MTMYTNDAALTGLANGATVTSSNTGGGGNTALNLVDGTVTTSNAHPDSHTSMGYHVAATSGALCDVRLPLGAGTTGNAFRMYFYLTGTVAPTTSTQEFVQLGSTGQNYIGVTTAGVMKVILQATGAYTGTYTLLANTLYRLEAWWTIAASGAQFHYALYLGDSNTPVDSYDTTTGNTGTSNPTMIYIGKHTTTGNWTDIYFSSIAANDAASGFIGVPASPPTASFTNAEVGLDVNVNGSASTATSPATITGYDWNWGDGTTHGSGSTATHTYAAAGTYTVTLTVTDSNSKTGNTSTSVTVTAPGTQAQPTSVTSSTGFTSNSGTVLNAITDLSSGQPVLTTFVSGGDGSVLVGAVGPVAPPANGNPLVAVVSCDRQLASTGTITGKLYEKDGVTLRSTATASIPDMTASGGSGTTLGNQSYVSIIWPWTDVQNVADWNQLVFSFTFNAS